MAKKKLSWSDLDKPLRDFGFKEGDELILPSGKPKPNANDSTTDEGGEDDGDEGDGNGGNHPPKKGGN